MTNSLLQEKRHPIQVLSPELQNQIAAGEVVERPASVLKELMENSLDAGATRLSVTIEQGGQGLIDIQDNGWGMTPDEIHLALTRHATSKLADASELNSIASFGFRGEALPSIASVSRMKISSIARGADTGFFVELEAGKVIDSGPAAMREGTRIEIRELFANVPARLKFLKTTTTETRRCQNAFFRLALTRPDVRMKLTIGGRKMYSFRDGQDLVQRLTSAWPPAVTEHLLPIDHERHGYTVTGVASTPNSTQARSDKMLFYVNGRPVSDKILLSAVRDAYSGRLLSREYPQCVLFLEVPVEHIDVNVHPAKTEVRFRDERTIFSVIRSAVLSALEQNLESQSHDADSFGLGSSDNAEENEASSAQGISAAALHGSALSSRAGSPLAGSVSDHTNASLSSVRSPSRGAGTSSFTERSKPLSRPSFTNFRDHHAVTEKEAYLDLTPDVSRDMGLHEPGPAAQLGHAVTETPRRTLSASDGGEYLGQLARTYLILRYIDGTLALIDQHAAHERVLYHSFEKAGKRGDTQPLAIPLELSLHPSESNLFAEIQDELTQLGFSFGEHSETSLEITGIPALLSISKGRDYLRAALSEQAKDISQLWAMLSCKAAIKANQILADDEALSLLEEWLATPDRDYCPHGRPVRVQWGLSDLEKLFKRRA
ncbi:DNA mismatch repair endonuclease MutL [Desulfobaculum bizertense]|uniref:DNA mismatch repair endonuclease MutL n=1 Tax=Desulfobaculum bizertense TaxID=376490 RepID=UPI001F2450F3|nr:DNA mismatch repair endonuclease MutL [Desulfobaculum bizertense]UIJ39081.1 DNA mismatch repair endonuclease MutL [Desulfobaculum bizertense]